MSSRLIPLGDRAYVDPDHIKFVQWSLLRNPYVDSLTGKEMPASVVVETYHKSYRIPCLSVELAKAMVETIMAEVGVRAMQNLLAPDIAMLQTRSAPQRVNSRSISPEVKLK